MKDPASPAAINALGTVNAPQDTKNSIVSVLKQKVKEEFNVDLYLEQIIID